MQSRYVGGIHETRASYLLSTLLRWQGYHYARFAFELNQKILFFIFSLICESISSSWIASKHDPTGILWHLSFRRHAEIYFFPNRFQHDLRMDPFWRKSDHPPSNRFSWFLFQPSSAFWLFLAGAFQVLIWMSNARNLNNRLRVDSFRHADTAPLATH